MPDSDAITNFGLVVSVLLIVLINFLGRELLWLLGGRDEIMELGLGYLRIVFNGSFTLILYFLCSAIMRGTGDSLTPMLVISVSTALNIALDPLLIFGIWIFPEMGVKGAALATVISQGLGMVAGLYILSRGLTRIRLSWRQYHLDFNLIGRMLKLSFPATLQGVVRSAANLILMRIVAGYGVFVLAAYGIGLRLDIIIMMPGWALGAAAATLVGQNLGAVRPDQAEKSAWIAAGLYIALAFLVGVFFFIFSRQVIGLFNKAPQILTTGSTYLRIITLSYGFLALGLVMAMALNGAGDTVNPMIISAVSLLVIQIPLALYLPKLLNNTLGIWLAIAAAFTVQGLAMAVWFKLGHWKKKQV